MGNTNTNTKIRETYYTYLTKNEEEKIRRENVVVDIDWLNAEQLNYHLDDLDTFKQYPTKKQCMKDMLQYYLAHEDKMIFEQTDYLCNQKSHICICNTHAEDFRKIYHQTQSKPIKYISWCKITK